MRNRSLANDFVLRAGKRIKAVETLFNEQAYADVVRESQEVVELLLKALLRFANVEVPHVHDVSAILLAERERLPDIVKTHVETMASISKELRRDRELAFYGTEDLTPSEFYNEDDAKAALAKAKQTFAWVSPCADD